MSKELNDYTKDSGINDKLISSDSIIDSNYSDNVKFESQNESTFDRDSFKINGTTILFSGINIYVGTGTPEANVKAPIGSVFFRRDGGAGTSMYVKESGTEKTGWVGK